MRPARARASVGGVVWSSAPQSTRVGFWIFSALELRSRAASARQARAKHCGSTAASAALRAAMIFGCFRANSGGNMRRSEEHTSELQSRLHLVCRLLLEKKKKNARTVHSD